MTPAAITGIRVLKNSDRVSSSAPSANRYTPASTGFGGTKPLTQSTTANSRAQTTPAYPASKACKPEPLAEQYLGPPDGAGHDRHQYA